jgi:hypothetical protein
MISARSAAALLSISLLACGGDDGGTKLVDARMGGGDGSGSNVTCSSALSIDGASIDIYQEASDQGFMQWLAPVSGMLADGNQLVASFEFYQPMGGAIAAGTYDFSTGMEANYATCRVCLRVIGGTQDNPRFFYPTAGVFTLTSDPIASQTFAGTITGLKLAEVTIDDQDFTSTPIPNGECANIPDFTAAADRIPNAYTCAANTYEDGTNCNCGCDYFEPDCFNTALPTMGCTGQQVCAYDDTAGTACVDVPANDTCATAPTALTLGTAVSGTNVGAKNDYDMGLEGANCTNYDDHDGGDVAYKVTLATGVTYHAVLVADGDLAVAVVGPSNNANVCTANPITTCVAGADGTDPGEDFTFTVPTAGQYYIIVDTFSVAAESSFTLTISAM